jgi:hypothetical protein
MRLGVIQHGKHGWAFHSTDCSVFKAERRPHRTGVEIGSPEEAQAELDELREREFQPLICKCCLNSIR